MNNENNIGAVEGGTQSTSGRNGQPVPAPMPATHYAFPLMLLVVYVLQYVALSLSGPYDHTVWLVESFTVMWIPVVLLTMWFRGVRFSNLSYLLMAILVFMHTWGGFYTFARVPFDWFNHMFGFERNMYDRVAHASVGLYAFPLVEYLLARGYVSGSALARRVVAMLFGLFAIMATACAYEIFEWRFAVSGDPTAGIEVLGSQGDIWDAQKDMLADTCGAIVAVLLAAAFIRRDGSVKVLGGGKEKTV